MGYTMGHLSSESEDGGHGAVEGSGGELDQSIEIVAGSITRAGSPGSPGSTLYSQSANISRHQLILGFLKLVTSNQMESYSTSSESTVGLGTQPRLRSTSCRASISTLILSARQSTTMSNLRSNATPSGVSMICSILQSNSSSSAA
ncbi:hypothetical protein CRG98_005896 [Punica granatum]|uniref:Uncharacterized protein n=1 Tax=Punica granatum TaxID=22663 RepID=A0A2I0KYV9_PUNGR|nr:hypothetical protein CRG98_005896 [Punica granatum]